MWNLTVETNMWPIHQETRKHVMVLDLEAIGRSIAVVFLSESEHLQYFFEV